MKKFLYGVLVFVLGLFFISNKPQVTLNAEDEASSITITINDRLPTSFLVGSTTVDFKPYFVVRIDNVRTPITDDQINMGGFNINNVGEYTIIATVTVGEITETKDLLVKVIDVDNTAPKITVNKAFHITNEFGQTPWDSQESMISFMARFTIWDDVDGYIEPVESMFDGIEKVRLNRYGEEYSIFISVEDSAGNMQVYGEIRLLIVNTIGSVIVEVEDDLPVEVVVNTEAPDFKKYFKITDVNPVEVTDTILRLGGFDITKTGTYTVSVVYQRQYVFNTNRDVGRASIVFKVIAEDVTAPEIITFRIDDNMIDGKLPWTYKQDLSIFMSRFRVMDNVDGVIPITEDMFRGIDLVDITTINTEYPVTFEVTDKAGNTSTKEVIIYVVDDVSPYITNFSNRYFRSKERLNILNVVKEVGIEDNYDTNGSVLKIVLNHKDLFEQVQLSYHDLERYKDRFTEEEIARAAKAYTYELVDGTYVVSVKAFRSDNSEEFLVDKEIEITIENGVIIGLKDLYEELGLDRENGIVMYYITNFEENKNGEFVMLTEAVDSSNNIAPKRSLRIVIENGPSLAQVILLINGGALVVFGLSVGIYFMVKKAKRNKASA